MLLWIVDIAPELHDSNVLSVHMVSADTVVLGLVNHLYVINGRFKGRLTREQIHHYPAQLLSPLLSGLKQAKKINKNAALKYHISF